MPRSTRHGDQPTFDLGPPALLAGREFSVPLEPRQDRERALVTCGRIIVVLRQLDEADDQNGLPLWITGIAERQLLADSVGSTEGVQRLGALAELGQDRADIVVADRQVALPER